MRHQKTFWEETHAKHNVGSKKYDEMRDNPREGEIINELDDIAMKVFAPLNQVTIGEVEPDFPEWRGIKGYDLVGKLRKDKNFHDQYYADANNAKLLKRREKLIQERKQILENPELTHLKFLITH